MSGSRRVGRGGGPAVSARTATSRTGNARRSRRRRGLANWATVALAIGLGIAVLAVIFFANTKGAGAGRYAYQVGKPGPGEAAPGVQLSGTDGVTFDLASLRGQTVMLFFQEGIMCEPCWDQIKDIEAHRGEIAALGIDRIVSITGDPLVALSLKVGIEGIKTTVLSDPDLAVSKRYAANQYGMMGESADGHSFVVVGKDGTIRWRADYGGAPNYTMYVPMPNLLADLKKGLGSPS